MVHELGHSLGYAVHDEDVRTESFNDNDVNLSSPLFSALQVYEDPDKELIMNHLVGTRAYIWSPNAKRDIREHVSYVYQMILSTLSICCYF